MNHLEALERETRAFRSAVGEDLTAAVPSCPGWTVRDLVSHLGTVQRFHALHVVRGVTDDPTERPPDPPEGGLLAWFDEGTALLLAALRSVAPDAPAWNFSPTAPKVAAFWPRRMALEAAVHRWDAECVGGEGSPVEAALAQDGIDEVLTVHRPADVQQDPPDVTGVVRVALTDCPRSWAVEVPAFSHTDRTPDAVLSGTASEVLLSLWGRVPLSGLELEGPESLVAALRTG